MRCAKWVGNVLTKMPKEVEQFAVTAGLGSGKTYGSVQVHLQLCVQNHLSRFSWYCEPKFELIREVAIPTFESVLESMSLQEGVHYSINRSNQPCIRLHFNASGRPVRHTIWLKSCQNYNQMVGANISHATIDEPGQINPIAYRKVNDRIRCANATRRLCQLTGTPEGMNHWFFDEFDIRANEVVDGYKYRFKLHTRDNTFHPDIHKYVKSLQRVWQHNPGRLESYLAGEFCNFMSNNAFTCWDARLLNHDYDIDINKDIYLTFDFNNHPLAWVANQVHGKKLVSIASSDGNSRMSLMEHTRDILTRLFPKQFYPNNKFIIYGDSSGHNSTTHLYTEYETITNVFKQLGRKCEVRAAISNPPITTSVEVWNSLMYNNMYSVIDNGYTEKVVMSIRKTSWKENTRKLHKPIDDDWTHWSDAMRYLVWDLVQNGVIGENERQIALHRGR